MSAHCISCRLEMESHDLNEKTCRLDMSIFTILMEKYMINIM